MHPRRLRGLIGAGGVGIACMALSGCRPPAATQESSGTPAAATQSNVEEVHSGDSPAVDGGVAPPESPVFVDAHERAGMHFQYDNGAVGKAFMVESIGGGAGWIDYDRDDWPDLYLVQGGDPLTGRSTTGGDRILRNLGGRFEDVTASTCRVDQGYGQGIAVGDYDGDGFEDVLVTNYGPDVLLQNQGDGTFVDVTQRTGVGDARWGSSAAWGDLDVDGDLDLFVCNYLKYDVNDPFPCPKADGTPGICHPEQVDPEDNECYENLGDGSFRPVAKSWRLLASGSKSLGVVIADFDRNGRPDIFVANDTTANHLFMQDEAGRFDERAVQLGCAVNALGQFQASMGVGFGDYDRNGYPDLYLTHFSGDSNTLYANLGLPGFHDVTRAENLHQPTLKYLGFGAMMSDFNCDGREDLFITNGHIDDWRDRGDLWHMPPQLFSYDGSSAWVEQSHRGGPIFEGEFLGRAVAGADYDADGDLDLVVVHQGAPAALLENTARQRNWLQVQLVSRSVNRRGVGATVTVQAGQQTLIQQLAGGVSYCAAHHPRLFFGLGDWTGQCKVSVQWPEGGDAQLVSAEPNRLVTVLQAGDSHDRP